MAKDSGPNLASIPCLNIGMERGLNLLRIVDIISGETALPPKLSWFAQTEAGGPCEKIRMSVQNQYACKNSTLYVTRCGWADSIVENNEIFCSWLSVPCQHYKASFVHASQAHSYSPLHLPMTAPFSVQIASNWILCMQIILRTRFKSHPQLLLSCQQSHAVPKLLVRLVLSSTLSIWTGLSNRGDDFFAAISLLY